MNHWQPTTTLDVLQLRAAIIAKIRAFFTRRHVLEVETPLLSTSTNPAVHLNSFSVINHPPLYLQTSPEFAMKRLLAAGSGDIYQISKAFRAQENGRLHHIEFTMLEWYRVNFTHYDLMDEVGQFLHFVLNTAETSRITYRDLFLQYLNVDPFGPTDDLKKIARQQGLNASLDDDHDAWLQLLLTHLIEPHLGEKHPLLVYDFPATQAMLARINPNNPQTAERFELYFKGMELANGFHELNNPQEQRARFVQENKIREQLNLPSIPLDEKFLASLASLPPCSGVALGVDRLVMIAAQVNSLAEVLTFIE